MSTTIQQFTPTIHEITNVQHLPCSQFGCTSLFRNSGQLNMHLTQHHKLLASSSTATTAAMRQFFCPIDTCKYHRKHGLPYPATKRSHFFGSMKLLKQHYLKVHAVRSLACPQCPRTFAAERLLRAHRQQCGQTFSCPQCLWPYQTLEALQTHCRRKGHPMPERQQSAPTPTTAAHASSTGELMRDLAELVRMKPIDQRRRPVAIAPKPTTNAAEVATGSTNTPASNTSQSSQTTQTVVPLPHADPEISDSIFLNHWQKRADESADRQTLPTVLTNHCSVQTEINLNNLHFLNVALDSNSMTGFYPGQSAAVTAAGHGCEHLCHIETQTDFERVAAELHTQTRTTMTTSGDDEQHHQHSADDDLAQRLAEAPPSPAMLYTDGHTQTHCEELLFGGWTHIETQTCWSPDPHGTEDFSEFLVSTETQTSLPP